MTTTAAKMAVALALLNVRTAVIAARDGGGGESMAVRGVAVAAVSGARRVAHLGRRVATRRAAARERQHTSGSMPNAKADVARHLGHPETKTAHPTNTAMYADTHIP